MKPNVVPHIFIAGSKNGRKKSVSVPKKSAPQQQRNYLLGETLAESITRATKSCEFIAPIKSIPRKLTIPPLQTDKRTACTKIGSKLYRSIRIQTKSSCRSKYITCNMKH